MWADTPYNRLQTGEGDVNDHDVWSRGNALAQSLTPYMPWDTDEYRAFSCGVEERHPKTQLVFCHQNHTTWSTPWRPAPLIFYDGSDTIMLCFMPCRVVLRGRRLADHLLELVEERVQCITEHAPPYHGEVDASKAVVERIVVTWGTFDENALGTILLEEGFVLPQDG